MRVVRVPYHNSVFCPADKSGFVDAEASRCFGFRQHAAVAESAVARAKRVLMDEIGDAQRGKTIAAAPGSDRSSGTKSLLIQNVSDFGVDVGVSRSLSTSSTMLGVVLTCCADDLGFSVVSVSVLPPLKQT